MKVENTVWYVEARSKTNPCADGKFDSCGSAVAVCLKERAEGSAAKCYLLTCAHVVRGKDAEGKEGFGPILEDILVWRPGSGFTRVPQNRKAGERVEGAHLAKIVGDLPTGDVKEAERYGANDWVLLEFDQLAIATTELGVDGWAEPAALGLKVIGYPAGAGKAGDIVQPTTVGLLVRRGVADGIITLTGPGRPRPGMSGGGLFNWNGTFAGLHRSSVDPAIQNRAVSSTQIRRRLEERYEICKPPSSDQIPPRRIAIGSVVALLAVVFLIWLLRPTKEIDAAQFVKTWAAPNSIEAMTQNYIQDSHRLTGTCKIKERTATYYTLYWPGDDVDPQFGFISVAPKSTIALDRPLDNARLKFSGRIATIALNVGVTVVNADCEEIEQK
jgi:Trypsin-like peptidase domain